MLRLPPFEYHAPTTLGQALKILEQSGPSALVVAGGTDIYPKMKRRQFQPKTLISLRNIKRLTGIQGSKNKGFVIKACTTLSEVAQHSVLHKAYPGLTQAVGLISTPILRNMGTLGGNLCLDTRCNYYDQTYHWRKSVEWCMKAPGPKGVVLDPSEAPAEPVPCRVAPGGNRCWAVSSSDSAPMLIALGAKIVLASAKGERELALKDFYRDDGIHYIAKNSDEILTEIHIPPPKGLKSIYLKLRRRGSFDFPVLGVAVALKQAQDETVTECKIVLGGIASHPVEFVEAEKLLIGHRPTEELIEQAAQLVFGPTRPMDNTDLHLYYRKRMAPVYVKRALRALATV
ncbi:MAG: FAD binding domain-containing protein [Candidatus Bipolaricaulota bacterium]|nr:FAD binding domain-containing protein [Candidatus Bipolaricaulota bacterium]MCS7274064.1 FAD binding domain-containing protein [Candidatus Bipolaricaulota bacterium]MDW8110661.1 xanthine dehydrogenase family protein subunit M [Candidatus Bipolaricaulota bacterium]MDW8328481.1 xanthine dehydrogenase family protein subunit M [Candidatus Bipolaricaulota bacterium]